MKSRCAGFVHSRLYEQGWEPCTRPATRGDKFCAAHREGFDAAMLSVAAENATTYAQERKIEAELRAHKRAVRKASRRKIVLPDEDAARTPRQNGADIYGERIFASARVRNSNRKFRDADSRATGQSTPTKAPTASPPGAAGRGDAQGGTG